jgi:hypothetical protein
MTSIAVERVEASWTELLAAIDGLNETQMSEPGVTGEWSVKDLLGHVAYWEGRAIGIVERRLNGEPDPAGGSDFEIVNQQVHAERADWSVAQMMDEFHGTHERFMAALRQYPQIALDDIDGNTFGHFDEHTAEIRAWRERVGA